MQQHKVFALITLIPTVFSLSVLVSGDIPISQTILIFVHTYVPFIFGLIGTIGLWRGKKWGYHVALLFWVYIIVVSIFFLFLILKNFANLIESFTFLKEILKVSPKVLFNLLYLFFLPIVGIIVATLLLRSLRQWEEEHKVR